MTVISEARKVSRRVGVLVNGYGYSWRALGRECGMHQERLKKGVRGERDLKLSEWVRIEGTVERLLDRARLNLERELRRVSRGSSKRINLLPPRSERDKVGRAKDRARELLSMGVCEVSAGIESSMEVETSESAGNGVQAS